MVEFSSLDLRGVAYLRHDLLCGRTAKALKDCIGVLETVLKSPTAFAPRKIWLGDPAVICEEVMGEPPPRDGGAFYGEGEGGSAILEPPPLVEAKRCLKIARQLLDVVEKGEASAPRRLINNALQFGVLMPSILGWYDGTVRARLEAPANAANAEKLARISEGGRKGAAVVNADHSELHSLYQSEIDKLMHNGAATGMSYKDAKPAVAKHFVVSESTVDNHTVNKWPRKGGRPKKAKKT